VSLAVRIAGNANPAPYPTEGVRVKSDRRPVFSWRRLAPLLVILALPLGWPARAQADLKVVTTVPALAAIAKEIAGNSAQVKSLTRSSQDPHFVDARPSLALDLNRADLLLAVGLELEVGWLPTLVTGARNSKILQGAAGFLDCSQFVTLQEVHNQPVSRSMGDIHPGGNPHYLGDPRAAAAVAKGIAGRLAQLDPAHQTAFTAGLTSFLAKLSTARAAWEKRLAPLRGSPVIEYHRTWVYLAGWIGLDEVGFLEPKPGIPPNPSHVAQLLVQGRQRKVKAILQEEYYPDSTSRLVAQQLGARLVRVPGGPDFQAGQSYLDYVDHLVTALVAGLGGTP
jgi:zinc/manganese transport system substrate-binding protein